METKNHLITINENSDKLEILIRQKNKMFPIIFIGSFAAMWLIVEIIVIWEMISDPNSFLLFFTFIWTASLLGLSYAFYNTVKDQQEIILQKGCLLLKNRGDLFTKIKLYDIQSIQKLKVVKESSSYGRRNKFYTLAEQDAMNGLIRFNFDAKVIKFAAFIDEDEAFCLLERLKKSPFLNKENFY